MTTPVNSGVSYLPTAGEGPVQRWSGTYAGTVVNNDDPLGVGRLQLNVPQVLGDAVSTWAVPNGSYYSIPNNGTTVSVVFLGGDPSKPAWTGPLDLSPIVIAAAPPSVTYSSSAPPNPRVGDIWYPIIAGVQGPPAVWTFNSGTSTYSWVTQPGIGATAIAAGTVVAGIVDATTITGATINGGIFNGTDWIENSQGQFFYSGAPGNPTVTPATTGGTVLAGTYQVRISYVNGTGESQASLTVPVTTTGTTSKITITSPPAAGNATGWYAYISQAGGFSPTRQQTAGSPTAIGTNFVLTAPPTNTGAAPLGASQAGISTPCKGCLIASVANLTGTDQFGNNVAAGVVSYVPDGVGNYTQFTQIYGGNVSVQNTNGSLLIQGGQVNFGGQLYISENAPGTTMTMGTGSPNTANLQVLLPLTANLVAEDPNSAFHFESWHTITVDSGWTQISGQQTPAVRLLPDGNIQLKGAIQHANFTVGTDINASNPLPVAYRPSVNIMPKVDGTNRAAIYVRTSGVITAFPNAAGNTQVDMSCIYYPST